MEKAIQIVLTRDKFDKIAARNRRPLRVGGVHEGRAAAAGLAS